MIELAGRGETFVRDIVGPSGSIPVVLLHGALMTADINYADVYEPLSLSHRVVAPDVRMHGHGSRDRGFTLNDASDDVIALLDTLGIERAILCGFSMGGGIAADVASRYPGRVAGSVISGTAACYSTRRRDRIVVAALNALRRLVAVGLNPSPGPLLLAMARRRTEVAMQRQEWLLRECAKNNLSDILAVNAQLPRVDLRRQLAEASELPCEYLLLTRDHLCHPELQRKLADLLGAHTTMLDVDHDFPITDPVGFAKAVVAAVARLDERLDTDRTVPEAVR
ncbi:MAG: alpha/beta hydrolase [Mycobacterium sp.]